MAEAAPADDGTVTDEDDEVFLHQQLSECGVVDPRIETTTKHGERIISSDNFLPGKRAQFFQLACAARNLPGQGKRVDKVVGRDGKTVEAITVKLMTI